MIPRPASLAGRHRIGASWTGVREVSPGRIILGAVWDDSALGVAGLGGEDNSPVTSLRPSQRGLITRNVIAPLGNAFVK
jgi:hypothetical protein